MQKLMNVETRFLELCRSPAHALSTASTICCIHRFNFFMFEREPAPLFCSGLTGLPAFINFLCYKQMVDLAGECLILSL